MLYIVATPIGNLKDITYRAVEVLGAVDAIACEDTRHSLNLLNAYGIKKPTFAYHKFNEKKEAARIVELLKSGKDVALITDAGTPVVSDPGNILVKTLIEEGLEYTVIPGATAFVPALVLSGFDASKFAFIGFLPEKKSEAAATLKAYADLPATLIFYCAPHDVEKTVATLYENLGDRKACAARELTKLHESVEFFSLEGGYTGETRGEFVILVEGAKEKKCDLSPEQLLAELIASGMDKKEAVRTAAKKLGLPKNEVYMLTVAPEDK